MKKVWALCFVIGVVLTSAAWLIGLILGDSWLYDDQSIETEITLDEIVGQLESGGVGSDNLTLIEQQFDATIQSVGSGDTGSTESGDPETEDWTESHVIELEDGSLFEVGLPIPEPDFFTSLEITQLLLHLLAFTATLGITWLLVNNRLRLLSGLTNDPAFTPKNIGNDPIQEAVVALQQAKVNIDSLNNERVEAVNDHRELLASVAHEFRNPLARLQFANEMAMEKSGDEQNNLLEEANIAAVELDDLVRETLSYSRLSGHEAAKSQERLSITDMFREIAASPLLSTTRVRVSIRYPEHDEFIDANRKLFIRATTNLLTNALRHATTLVQLSTDKQDGVLLISVADDGIGIPAVHQQRIFEPFYRVERSRSRESGGFGLGLSIVKSIVEKHGASIEIVSPHSMGASIDNDHSGTCFIIRWELAE